MTPLLRSVWCVWVCVIKWLINYGKRDSFTLGKSDFNSRAPGRAKVHTYCANEPTGFCSSYFCEPVRLRHKTWECEKKGGEIRRNNSVKEMLIEQRYEACKWKYLHSVRFHATLIFPWDIFIYSFSSYIAVSHMAHVLVYYTLLVVIIIYIMFVKLRKCWRM